jgi:[acyl-carrier-protein] S-malonyltransferase
MKNIFIFPGQGVQNNQMLKQLKSYSNQASLDAIKEISDVCGFDVARFIEESSNEIISRTEYTQIVVFAMNVAYLRLLEDYDIRPDATAGHSVGQYAALIASRVLSLKDATGLIKERARLMSEVKTPGRLCAVRSMNIDIDLLHNICYDITKNIGTVQIALYNSEEQIVVGGLKIAVEKFCEELKNHAGYFTKMLAVGQAFHTPLMNDMTKEFKTYVDKVQINTSEIPIILNSTGQYYDEQNQVNDLRKELVEQCVRPVLWTDTIKKLLNTDSPFFFEVGPGHSLCALLKKFGNNINSLYVEDKKSLMTYFKEMEKREYVETF